MVVDMVTCGHIWENLAQRPISIAALDYARWRRNIYFPVYGMKKALKIIYKSYKAFFNDMPGRLRKHMQYISSAVGVRFIY